MTTFIALLHKDTDSDFGVSFPDFPGCVTAASDLDSLRRNAAEALALHIEGMLEDGEHIPTPTALEDVDHAGPLLLVEAPRPTPRSLRVNVTLPEDVVRAIDQVTDNRSRFLAEAAREKLQHA
ncbi:MAG: type II toxin-antitoxin system HicB family antitoxin [Gluconacetobacter diazotrophicus]|nr:type II toxin-antitoxin system HicB family antitoxin [Gluconacetobacter diazotrophicus]